MKGTYSTLRKWEEPFIASWSCAGGSGRAGLGHAQGEESNGDCGEISDELHGEL